MPAASSATPLPWLFSMVLPSPAAVPPITFFVAPDSTRMPLSPLPSPAAALALVPMRLPSTSLLYESLSIWMPASVLPGALRGD